jgi:FdhE protein
MQGLNPQKEGPQSGPPPTQSRKEAAVAGKITRLLSRQTPEQSEVTAAITQLTHLAEVQPDLRQAAALQAAFIRALYGAAAPVSPPTLTAEEATARLAGGMPLLRNLPLPCDVHHLHAVFLRLCEAAWTVRDTETHRYRALATAVSQRHLDLWTLANTLLTGAAQALPAQLEAQGHPADLMMTLPRLALLPCLEHVRAQLAPLRANQPWSHGYCLTCGAWPVLAEQHGLEQLRYLRCGLCGDAWEVERLWCPFCANRDHTLLGYLYVEGEEQKQRVATCDACQSYIKLRSTLIPFTPLQLLVEELALVHLDLIAMERGYLPPS